MSAMMFKFDSVFVIVILLKLMMMLIMMLVFVILMLMMMLMVIMVMMLLLFLVMIVLLLFLFLMVLLLLMMVLLLLASLFVLKLRFVLVLWFLNWLGYNSRWSRRQRRIVGILAAKYSILKFPQSQILLKPLSLNFLQKAITTTRQNNSLQHIEYSNYSNQKHPHEQQDIDTLVLFPYIVQSLKQNCLSQLLPVQDYSPLLLLHRWGYYQAILITLRVSFLSRDHFFAVRSRNYFRPFIQDFQVCFLEIFEGEAQGLPPAFILFKTSISLQKALNFSELRISLSSLRLPLSCPSSSPLTFSTTQSSNLNDSCDFFSTSCLPQRRQSPLCRSCCTL